MAKYIHCSACKNNMAASAARYAELYETVEGPARYDMLCDGCGRSISEGENAFAALLLPNMDHRNYPAHRPVEWYDQYLK